MLSSMASGRGAPPWVLQNADVIMFGSAAQNLSLRFWDTTVAYRAWETVTDAVIVHGTSPGDPSTDKTGGLVWSAGRTLSMAVSWPPFVRWMASTLGAPSISEGKHTLESSPPDARVIELGCGPGS